MFNAANGRSFESSAANHQARLFLVDSNLVSENQTVSKTSFEFFQFANLRFDTSTLVRRLFGTWRRSVACRYRSQSISSTFAVERGRSSSGRLLTVRRYRASSSSRWLGRPTLPFRPLSSARSEGQTKHFSPKDRGIWRHVLFSHSYALKC